MSLVRDVLEMEFTRYADDTKSTMSELDFSRHLLYSSSISQKRKEKMIKRVAEEFGGENGKGISFDSFLTFYNVLFGGADLERAMFFLDEEHFGVTRDEFIKVANWVVGVEVDPHVVEVRASLSLQSKAKLDGLNNSAINLFHQQINI